MLEFFEAFQSSKMILKLLYNQKKIQQGNNSLSQDYPMEYQSIEHVKSDLQRYAQGGFL